MENQKVREIPTVSRTTARAATAEQVARLTVRFCYALRDANRLSWFAPEVREQIEDLHAELLSLAAERPVRIRFEAEAIRIGDARMEDPPKAARQLIRMVHRKGFQAIEMTEALRPLDVVVLLQVLQSKSRTIAPEDLAQLRAVRLLETDEPDRIELPEILRPSQTGRVVRDDADGDVEVRSLVRDITSAIDNISHEPAGVPAQVSTSPENE